MYPILFSYNQFTVYSLGTLLVIGFVVFNILVVQLSAIKKLNIKFWNNHVISLAVGTLVGARALYVAFHWERFQENWQQIWLPDGFSFYGGISLFIILLYFYTKKSKEDFLVWSDVFTVSFFAFLFFSGIGHFLDGSNYGIPTDLPWGVTFDDISSPVQYTVPIHPTQLYQSLAALLIFVGLISVYKKTKFKGVVTFLGAFLLGTLNFFLGYLSGENVVIIGVLRVDQLVDLIAIALSSGMLFSFLLKRHEL